MLSGTDSGLRSFNEKKSSQRIDFFLLFVVLVIILMGLVNLYSATVDVGTFHSSFFYKQLIYYGLGFLGIFSLQFIDYRLFLHFAYIVYGVNLIMLMLVPFIGVLRNGARSWINLGLFHYQPSETMKLSIILALAKYFHTWSQQGSLTLKNLRIPLLIIAVPTLLTMKQPDMGTGFHLGVTGVLILLFVGVQKRIIISSLLALLVMFPPVWNYGLKEYQRDRIRTFIDPMRDPKGKGYNAIQSIVAVGSGEILGKGFKKGTQTQLNYTPEGHTDFIFTVLAEEWGMLGCLLFMFFLILLLWRCLFTANLARDKFGALVCVGVMLLIGSQALINIMMVSGLFPIVGIPLPLASYGGTSVLTICIALGLVVNVGFRRDIQ